MSEDESFLYRPFGPSIFKVTIPEKMILDLNNYVDKIIKDEEKLKEDIVINFVKKNEFKLIADLGCNDGVYSHLALNNGCKSAIGFDFDIK